MAEGFFRKHLADAGDQVSAASVKSAGLEPHGVHPKAIQVMREVGIDISGQTSNHLSEYLSEDFDYVITVCDNAAANCPVFPGDTVRLHWPFDDPAAVTGDEDVVLSEFRRIRDDIGAAVKRWLSEQNKP